MQLPADPRWRIFVKGDRTENKSSTRRQTLPLLFSLFIADLYFELRCKGLDVTFDADELVLGSHSQCQLQQSLKNLNTYWGRNYLKINVNKTKCLKFRRGDRLAVD